MSYLLNLDFIFSFIFVLVFITPFYNISFLTKTIIIVFFGFGILGLNFFNQNREMSLISEKTCSNLFLDKDQCQIELKTSHPLMYLFLDKTFKVTLVLSSKSTCSENQIFYIKNGQLENSHAKCKKTLKFEVLNQPQENWIKIVNTSLIDQALNSQRDIILSKSKEFLNSNKN